MDVTKSKMRKGITLVEVMLAVLVFVVAVLGTSYAFAFGRGEIKRQEQQRIAVLLAGQGLDELKATEYDEIKQGETIKAVTLSEQDNGLTYFRTIQVADEEDESFKTVTATVRWGLTGVEHSLALTTIIAP